jgi:hypothetical protein
LYKNHSDNSLSGDLSNDTTVNPPLFSLVNTFKQVFLLYSRLLFTRLDVHNEWVLFI